jgi:hypothetical protein
VIASHEGVGKRLSRVEFLGFSDMPSELAWFANQSLNSRPALGRSCDKTQLSKCTGGPKTNEIPVARE